MKERKAKDLRELNDDELRILLEESRESLSKQSFQHALKQLHDTTNIRVLRRDIARLQTIIKERSKTV